ncbi:TraI domain-containing protein [Legionella oakridgensis]|uniref:Integrating conjugative element relaxase n=2 Tax=Legionella oakridgensis TaxID=29423 RepID=W0BIX4_9GAMM|nr:TraI domain-containing protein [Legionella oakridgensis]AHE68359.1 integrating conjugative element relaxase [Legionella oakridgensis ATCC 33761 = DSM 21215]ETO92168.1 integrating conjugative element relaxase, PFL_4751 family [Legionella oakridgensis RV-2-2007]KTD38971.1 putative helicase/relaxase [Legionella oakridgensis]STY21301.1 putative helicase/relaxase [Legionella longbeachae]
MFHRYSKKAKSPSSKPLKDLTAVESPAQLLADAKRQELLAKIKLSSGLEGSRFELLCMPLIHNFINHGQSLPETSNSYYSLPGGLLDHALNRTEAALHLFREYVLQEGAELSEEQKLWVYALFSAGILQGIGKLQNNYSVELFDLNGQQLKQWNPLLESMASVGRYYHFEFQKESEEELRRRLNLLLGRALMPANGFSWIAANPQVLAVWLALLNEDWQSAGTLGAVLIRADAIAIQRYFSEFLIRNMAGRGGRANRISTFIDSIPDSLAEKERLIGMEFIKWLTIALEKGQIMINKAPLFMVPGGLLMCAEIFKYFVREHPEFKNWQAIQKGFLSLGLHKIAADGEVISRFEQSKNQQMVSGIVVSDYAVVLPNQVKVHNLNTGKITEQSATELINTTQQGSHFTQKLAGTPSEPLRHLAANGQWQVIETSVAQVKLENKHNG